MTSELETALENHAFLRDIARRHIESISKYATEYKYPAGSYIFREGEEAREFFLVRSGRVQIELGAEQGTIVVQSIGPGDIVGWSWLLPPHRWRFDAHVIEPVEALIINGAKFRAEMEEDHELGYRIVTKMLRVLSQRLEGSRLQLMDLYSASY